MTSNIKPVRVDGRGKTLLAAIQEAFQADFEQNRSCPSCVVTTEPVLKLLGALPGARQIAEVCFPDHQDSDGQMATRKLDPGQCVEVNGVPAFASKLVPNGCIYMGKAWHPGVIDSPPLDEMHIQIYNIA